jgi:hypothetical protein
VVDWTINSSRWVNETYLSTSGYLQFSPFHPLSTKLFLNFSSWQVLITDAHRCSRKKINFQKVLSTFGRASVLARDPARPTARVTVFWVTVLTVAGMCYLLFDLQLTNDITISYDIHFISFCCMLHDEPNKIISHLHIFQFL